ncbi:hypothetical protein J4573_53220 [Actinomadura barringtoniae]|uniref:DUF4235 domain-containing protein n=1 Tax=Actinomadura barringtoniae TaxID=1427535 RepID=A0A939TGZ1_9ACTN|nr:hypothetical protein [Actinomadura barringtoniae]MBO2455920.1 hypothetical protein [Actinomadura barringtoniae]
MSKASKNEEPIEGVPLSPEESAQRSAAARIGGGVVGMIAGRVAGRAFRPVARKVAGRFGLPAASITRVIEVATPVLAALIAGQLAKRKAQKQSGPPHDEAPGAMSLVPRQESARQHGGL